MLTHVQVVVDDTFPAQLPNIEKSTDRAVIFLTDVLAN